MGEKRYLIADVETTGVEDSDKITEVGWVQMTSEIELLPDTQFESIINPEIPIPCNVSGITGIRSTMFESGGYPTIDEIEFPDGEFILIAHNSQFDKRFLEKHINIVGEICTLRLARRLLPDVVDRKLATLACYLDLPMGTSHQALDDVWDCYGVLKFLLEESEMDLEQAKQYLLTPVILKKCNFGKYDGRDWKDVPVSYMNWILNEGFDDPDIMTTAKYWVEERRRKS